MPKAAKKTPPVHKAKLGFLQLAVWANEHEVDGTTRTFHTITLERNYKDDKDEWQKTTQLRARDLGHAIALIQEAQRFLMSHE